jgi:hypothetical protein
VVKRRTPRSGKASSAQLTEVEEALLHEMLLRQLEVEALLADVV